MATWIVVSILEPLLRKKAQGRPGGVPASYFLMITPPMCLAYWGLNWIHLRLGYYLIGGLNLVFLAGALIACAKHARTMVRNARRAPVQP